MPPRITTLTAATDGPRLYFLHPLLAGPLNDWPPLLERVAAMGFSHVLIAPPFSPARHGSVLLSATHDTLHPALGWQGDAGSGLRDMTTLARAAGLDVLMDLVPDRVAGGSALSQAPDSPFTTADTSLDPRRFDPEGEAATAPDTEALAQFWRPVLAGWVACGIAGFRLIGMHRLKPAVVRRLAEGLAGRARLYGWMEAVPRDRLASFAGCGLDYVFSSLPWWDGRRDWYWREHAALRQIAPVITAAEAPFGARLDPAARTPALCRAALLGSGWMMVMGSEFGATARLDPRRDTPADFAVVTAARVDLTALVTGLNAARRTTPCLSANGAPVLLTGPGAEVLAVARPEGDLRLPGEVAIVTLNLTSVAVSFDLADAAAGLGGYYALDGLTGAVSYPPGAWTVATLHWRAPPGLVCDDLAAAARAAAAAPRIAIEAVTPSVDGGQFTPRRAVGETVAVEADILCDGHDQLAAALCWQGPDDAPDVWHKVPMRLRDNDRWVSAFMLPTMGLHRFTIEAWKDVFGTYRDELSKKVAAGLDVALELREGRLLISDDALRTAFDQADPPGQIALLLSESTAELMRSLDTRAFLTSLAAPLRIEAERGAARFASWYEIFPRSMSGDATRHGTFDDVISQLPRISAMGFDVLYFPPIHPIGMTHRKGRNNALVSAPDEPGSPYGIADHTAVHPQLGSLADFRRLREAAGAHGLELALDFAIQCSPDHRWLTEHEGWFDWRPDGSIRYAENPPKKYQDIVNVDFYRPASREGLWQALCEVVLFWCDQGVRIFRVDNPHTKPLPFWSWMIDEVHARHPDVLFLAEAFTRPKIMYRLAKVGFSQSYTYFTWRHTKAEFVAYLTELTSSAPREFFRPNFFVNTPDINPVFLQTSGRAGHLIRAALASMLAGLWGMYSGFELCEANPLPGREEYLDSEKYQIRAWDWDRPGNIVPELTRLNWIRRLNPALQTHLGLTFLEAWDDNILYFEKATADRSNVVLVAINLDPTGVHEADFAVPLFRWNLPDDAAIEVEDLVFETQTVWHGRIQRVRLDPDHNPYAIWRVRPR